MIEEIGKEKFAYLAAAWLVCNMYALSKLVFFWLYYLYCRKRYDFCHPRHIGLKLKYYLQEHTDGFQDFIFAIDVMVGAFLLTYCIGNVILEHL